MTLFFSNRCDFLAEKLFNNLYIENPSPFAKRFVIVPSKGMKFWLERWLAKKAIFLGVEIMPLDSALKRILQEPPSVENDAGIQRQNELHKKYIPTHVELLLAISDLLKEPDFAPSSLDPLFSEKIAHCFKRYSLYGYECFENWEERSEGWQERLWNQLFGKKGPFIALARALKKDISFEGSLHLFGLSHLPLPLFHVFSKLNSFFYQVSFCKEFWSDILSDRELLSISSKDLISLAQEWPPLLANFAVVMRKGLPALEESSLYRSEYYLLPEGGSQLQRAQASTLSFEKSQGIASDSSIQIHMAPNRAREVEILHNRIIQLLSLEGYQLSDLLILASDIELYLPYLTAYLPFPLTILDHTKPIKGSSAEAFLLFLNLEKRRFSSVAVMEFLSHPTCKQKQRFTNEDLQIIRKWMQELNICWGFDLAHKNRLLRHNENSLVEDKNSFSEAFKRVLNTLSEETSLIKLNQLELFYQFHELIHTLYQDLSSLFSEEERSFSDYCKIFERIASYYFLETESDSLQRMFEQLKIQAGIYKESTLSFAQIYSLLQTTLLSTHAVINQNGIDTLLCSSLSTSSQLPFKVIYIMGLEEPLFPRKESSSYLDLLCKEKIQEYVPSKSDFDRGFFLEAFFSCQERFIMSYIETPSPIVQEFIDALGTVTTYEHPQQSFDPIYFMIEDPNFRSWVPYECTLAKGFSTKKQEKSEGTSRPFMQLMSRSRSNTTLISIEDLLRFIKSPLKHTFKHKAGLYFAKEHTLKEEESFTLSAWENALMVRNTKIPLDVQVQALRDESEFPQAQFGQIALNIVAKKIELQQSMFAQHGIDPKELTTLQLETEPIQVGPYLLGGRIEHVFQNGLVVFEKADFAGALRAYPAFLALNMKKEAKKLIFAKDVHSKERFFDHPEPLLIKIIELYLWAQEHQALLFPELIEPILLKDKALLTKNLEQLWTNTYDEALHLAYRYHPFPPASSLIEEMYERVHATYQELKDGWF